MEHTKFCPQCGEDRPVSEFYVNKARLDGLSGYCTTHHNQDGSRRRLTQRLATIEALGGECQVCGFDDYRALQIDHVKGDGYMDRGMNRNQPRFYAKVLAHPEDYALLCANCNQIKKHEEGETVGRRTYARAVTWTETGS
jgi:hypothetical protein